MSKDDFNAYSSAKQENSSRGARTKAEKKYPLNLTQDQVDGLAQSLYKLQHIVDIASESAPANDVPFMLLSELRRQCCGRSKAADPFPDLPLAHTLPEAKL
jgi:hypothetical protein